MNTPHFIAYLDPGSSGLIVQMIGGGLAAFVVALKLYGRRILQVLRLRRRDTAPDAAPEAVADDRAR
ncbi:MAG: hypothetical protein QOK28_3689 [Actinomycetota bacterium]|jgi:hypothetical protein